jgi:hypothetical protein
LGHAPVIDVLPAAHCVGEMDFPVIPAVGGAESRSNTAFRHYRMSFAE